MSKSADDDRFPVGICQLLPGCSKKEAPVCVACYAVNTVKYILIEYTDLLEIRICLCAHDVQGSSTNNETGRFSQFHPFIATGLLLLH